MKGEAHTSLLARTNWPTRGEICHFGDLNSVGGITLHWITVRNWPIWIGPEPSAPESYWSTKLSGSDWFTISSESRPVQLVQTGSQPVQTGGTSDGSRRKKKNKGKKKNPFFWRWSFLRWILGCLGHFGEIWVGVLVACFCSVTPDICIQLFIRDRDTHYPRFSMWYGLPLM